MSWKLRVHKSCTWMFTEALFIFTKREVQCPSMSDIPISLYTHIMKYYSDFFKSHQSHKNTWRNLKCLLVSRGSQSEKAAFCMIPPLWHSGMGKLCRDSEMVGGCWGLRCEGGSNDQVEHRGFLSQWNYSQWQWWMHLSDSWNAQHRANPNVNYGLWLIIMYQYGPSIITNVPH